MGALDVRVLVVVMGISPEGAKGARYASQRKFQLSPVVSELTFHMPLPSPISLLG